MKKHYLKICALLLFVVIIISAVIIISYTENFNGKNFKTEEITKN